MSQVPPHFHKEDRISEVDIIPDGTWVSVVPDWAAPEGSEITYLNGSTFRRYKIVDGTWREIGEGGVAGSDTEIQFNDGGVLGADPTLTYDKTTRQLTIGEEDATTTIQVPDASTADTNGATLQINAGYGNGSADGGSIGINAGGSGNTEGVGGTITINPGQGKGSSNQSGDIRLTSRKASDANARQGRVLITDDTVFSERFVNALSTTDATPTSQTLFSMSGNISVFVLAKVIARRTGGTAGAAGDSAAYIRRALYKTISGTTSLVGSVQDDFTAEDQAGWDVTLAISGNDIQLQVTGAANNNITWDYEIFLIHTATAIL